MSSAWDYDEVVRQISEEEEEYLHWMVDSLGNSRKRYVKWTNEQVISRCKNMVEQKKRRSSHGTGAR